jgi:signal transduction histidine kinase
VVISLGVAHGPPATRSTSSALVATLVVSGVVSVASFFPLLRSSTVLGLLDVGVVVAFAATGVVLCEERDQRGAGAALGLTGVFYLVSWWWTWPPEWQVGPVPFLSYVFGYLWFVLGVYTLLRYPEPVLARWWDRWYVALLGCSVIVPKLVLTFAGPPSVIDPHYARDAWWPPTLLDSLPLQRAIGAANIALTCVAVLVLVPLVLKVRRARGIDRIDAVPGFFAAATVMVSGSAYLLAKLWSLPTLTVDALRAVIGVAALFTPLAFLGSALRRRFLRASLADLVVRLVDSSAPQAIEAQLRQRLPDPTLTVWLWLPAQRAFTSASGLVVDHLPDHGRYPEEIRNREGRLLAVLLLDPALSRHPNLVGPAVAACQFSLENAQMHADSQAQLVELRESAARNAEAEQRGRQRIERDLHDGAQQSLTAVRLSLARARRQVAPRSPAYEAISQAQSDLNRAAEELRQLARGIAPPILTQSGLRTALGGVIERLGVPVISFVTPDRLNATVEAIAYFVACEGLNNAVRYAKASRLSLEIVRDEGRLLICIDDDGRGGATMASGTGLVGIRDRARAIGGGMELHSPEGRGTRITVALPCG